MKRRVKTITFIMTDDGSFFVSVFIKLVKGRHGDLYALYIISCLTCCEILTLCTDYKSLEMKILKCITKVLSFQNSSGFLSSQTVHEFSK